LRPGKEELYRTGDDLAAAIRSGEVDGHSRIYHRSTSKWISITLHPQYKAITAQKPAQQGDRSWTYLTDQAETLESTVGEPEGGLDRTSQPEDDHRDGESDNGDSPWRRPITLGISGLFLVFGIQLAFSGPRPAWSTHAMAKPSGVPAVPAAREPAAQEPAPSSQVVSLASTSAGWDEAEAYREEPAPEPAVVKKAPAVLPKAPRLGAKSLHASISLAREEETEADAKSIDGLLAGYSTAYETARERLGSGVRVARLDQLFASSRLTPDGGVTDVRLGLAGVTNVVRVYREQERTIEREFQDSFTAMSKDLGWSPKIAKRWYSRTEGKDSPALVSLTNRLLAGIDSVLAVLTSEAGAYQLENGKVHFEDIAASREYSELRRNINAAVDSARIAGGEESAGPMGHLLKAIGTTRLPVER
ncbi:MAG: hypothetical protein ACREM9_06540, partial [Gemmatimonadales bacterium]